MRTTNIQIHTDKIDFTELLKEYHIYRYKIPHSYNFLDPKHKYERLTIEIQEKLNSPFYFFTKDREGPHVYLLSPVHNGDLTQFSLTSVNDFLIKPELLDVSFFEPTRLHILIKLIVALFFHNIKKTHRISQPKFYVLGKRIREYLMMAVEVIIKSDKVNGDIHEFSIVTEANKFRKIPVKEIKNGYPKFIPYFEEIVKGDTVYLRRIKREKVMQQTGIIWTLAKKSILKPASLNWYNYKEPTQNKSYITYSFQEKFVKFFNKWLGKEVANVKTPLAKEFNPKTPIQLLTNLPLQVFNTIYVYDNRLQDKNGNIINRVSLASYVSLLNQTYGKDTSYDLQFESINNLVSCSKNDLVLVLQDYIGEAFIGERQSKNTVKEAGLLFQAGFHNDPKKLLYDYFPSIPKQTVSVNPNKLMNKGKSRYKTENYLDYFDYDLLPIDKGLFKKGTSEFRLASDYRNKFDVCLNELYLKHFIMNNRPITDKSLSKFALPCFKEAPNLLDYAYMTNNTLLYIKDRRFQFIDLQTRSGKNTRRNILKKLFNLDWLSISIAFGQKHRINPGDEESEQTKLRNAHFIFSKGMAVEIVDTNERVLFKFEKGMNRTIETTKGLRGIYYLEEDNAYTAGSKGSIKPTLRHGVVVRRFICYEGKDKLKTDEILELLAVQFVKNKQYTAYPYPYDLIRLFEELTVVCKTVEL